MSALLEWARSKEPPELVKVLEDIISDLSPEEVTAVEADDILEELKNKLPKSCEISQLRLRAVSRQFVKFANWDTSENDEPSSSTTSTSNASHSNPVQHNKKTITNQSNNNSRKKRKQPKKLPPLTKVKHIYKIYHT